MSTREDQAWQALQLAKDRFSDAAIVVYDEHPFAAHVHECTCCCYLIGESEWDVVGEATAGNRVGGAEMTRTERGRRMNDNDKAQFREERA